MAKILIPPPVVGGRPKSDLAGVRIPDPMQEVTARTITVSHTRETFSPKDIESLRKRINGLKGDVDKIRSVTEAFILYKVEPKVGVDVEVVSVDMSFRLVLVGFRSVGNESFIVVDSLGSAEGFLFRIGQTLSIGDIEKKFRQFLSNWNSALK